MAKSHFPFLFFLFLLSHTCFSQHLDTKQRNYEANELLESYPGQVELPNDLLNTYTGFVNSLNDTIDLLSVIRGFCLPNTVQIVPYTKRPENEKFYGQNINLHFLLNYFHPQILNLRRENEDCYLIRTGSSALWFVRTKSIGWKLYEYLDKPIA